MPMLRFRDRGQVMAARVILGATDSQTVGYRSDDRFDLLALPVTQVWPFAIEQRWPQSVAGRPMDTYHRWMESTVYASFAGLPAISLPAGFHANGRWPAGLQWIARPQADAALLRAAAGYEAISLDLLARRPAPPAGTGGGAPASAGRSPETA